MRRFALFLVVAQLVAVTFFYPLMAPVAHRIDRAHFDLINDGMTLAEVEAIFGVPAGSYDWAKPDHAAVFHFLLTAQSAANRSDIAAQDDASTRRHELIHSIIGSHVLRPDSHETIEKVWVGRHGAFTIQFNQRRVAARSAWPDVRIEPPWNRWWKKILGP